MQDGDPCVCVVIALEHLYLFFSCKFLKKNELRRLQVGLYLMIPYGRQNIEDEDIEAVVEVLRGDFITQGPTVERFEAALAEACGAHAVIVGNSATSMLHAAYLALDIGPGDLVWTTPITFVATANAAIMCGGGGWIRRC